ncbi:MAG: ParB/RepB/Spo0J family partition protein [Chloroflexi bacterium]|nr:ParB/RepB/Spo0J family partition protein [Chloroflexota bacterium]
MADAASLVLIDPRKIQPDPENVRREGPDDLNGLAESIREHGLLQPLGVARENGGFRVIYGSRRRAAAIIAGLPEVPCLVVQSSDEDRLIRQMLENLQRRELGDMDKAEGFARLRRNLARSHPDIGERELDELVGRRLGLSATTVRRYLGLRELQPAVRDLLADGGLTVTQAQHLLAVADPTRQTELATLAAERGLSAAALSRACRAAIHRPTLSPAEAIELGERDEVPTPIAKPTAEAPVRVPRAPRLDGGDEDDRDLWIGSTDAAPDDGPAMPAGPRTADGHRVFKIKSVSAFADEIDRLARALQDGDLARAADEEPDAPIQLRLVARQLDYVKAELHKLLKQRGWNE